MKLRDLNLEIARALGVENPESVTNLDLRVRPGCWPTVTVERYVVTDDGKLSRLITNRFELRPTVSKPIQFGEMSGTGE